MVALVYRCTNCSTYWNRKLDGEPPVYHIKNGQRCGVVVPDWTFEERTGQENDIETFEAQSHDPR